MTASLSFDFTDAELHRGTTSVIKGLNMASGPGVVGVLGPNGSGKTTLLRALATVRQPHRGRLTISGHDVSNIEARRMARFHIGYAPQNPMFPPRMRCVDAVDLLAVMKELGPGRRTRLTEVWRAIDIVDMRERATERLGRLSGGMRHRVAIAQALVGDPDLLILDEPMAGLDPEQRLRLGVELRRGAKERTVMVATHQVDDVVGVCDRIIVLDHGQVIFDGHPLGLAAVAAGRVWEVEPNIDAPQGARPMPAGRWRVLGARPDGAVAVNPDPVDGYRLLLSDR